MDGKKCRLGMGHGGRWKRPLAVASLALLAGCAGFESPPSERPITAEGRPGAGQARAAGRRQDSAGWAADIYAAFATLEIRPSAENICSVVAVIGQESSFQADPATPGLAQIARREMDKRRESAGSPSSRSRPPSRCRHRMARAMAIASTR
jgi:hypothetical protein